MWRVCFDSDNSFFVLVVGGRDKENFWDRGYDDWERWKKEVKDWKKERI